MQALHVADGYWQARRGSLAWIDPPRATQLCSLCGAALVDDLEHDARVCPTHGRQIRYTVRGAGGQEYPADPRMAFGARMGRPPNPEALEMLRDGARINLIVFRTGVPRKVLYRLRECVERGEL